MRRMTPTMRAYIRECRRSGGTQTPWREADDMRLKLAYGKAPIHVIAKQLNRTSNAIRIRWGIIGPPIVRKAPRRSHYIAILTEECAAEGLKLSDALSRSKRRPLCYARFRTWSRLRPQYSYSGIGMVAGVDHTTVLLGVRRLEQLNAQMAGRP